MGMPSSETMRLCSTAKRCSCVLLGSTKGMLRVYTLNVVCSIAGCVAGGRAGNCFWLCVQTKRAKERKRCKNCGASEMERCTRRGRVEECNETEVAMK